MFVTVLKQLALGLYIACALVVIFFAFYYPHM